MRLITKATLLGLTLFSASVFASGQKTLKVGIEDSIAPFEFREKGSTEVIGFDVDIIKAIAKEQGFAVEIDKIDNTLSTATQFFLNGDTLATYEGYFITSL